MPRTRLGCEQVQDHGGNERAREEIAGEHRKYHRHSERREQRATDTAEKQNRDEHDAD